MIWCLGLMAVMSLYTVGYFAYETYQRRKMRRQLTALFEPCHCHDDLAMLILSRATVSTREDAE